MIELAIQGKASAPRPHLAAHAAPRHGFAAALSRSLVPARNEPADDPRQEDAESGSELPGDPPVQLPCGYVPPTALPFVKGDAPQSPGSEAPHIADAAAPVILVPTDPAAAAPSAPGREAALTSPVPAASADPAILVPLAGTPATQRPLSNRVADTEGPQVDPATISVAPSPPVQVQADARPAAQLFGVAWRQATSREGEPLERATARIDAAVPFVTATHGAHAVAAVMHDAGATLDLRQDSWPRAMIDHIERLRDAADAADGSIRVVPSALGPIDVSVRRERDVVHVHFSAEQAATRALLGDAQPRLAEYAETRGLKLGQTSIGGDPRGSDAGTAHQHQSQRQPAEVAPAPAPQRHRSGAAAAADPSTRIA